MAILDTLRSRTRGFQGSESFGLPFDQIPMNRPTGGPSQNAFNRLSGNAGDRPEGFGVPLPNERLLGGMAPGPMITDTTGPDFDGNPETGGSRLGGMGSPDANPLRTNVGIGTEDDPLFGSGGTAEELPGGREGGYQFRTTPGYNFRLQQAQEAVENSAASRGGLLSGNTLKDLTRFSQGLAEEEFQNVFNMLGSMRGGGATANMSNAAQAFGANAGAIMQNTGQAQAQGILGANQAFQSGLGGGLGILSTLGGGGTLSPINMQGLPSTVPMLEVGG